MRESGESRSTPAPPDCGLIPPLGGDGGRDAGGGRDYFTLCLSCRPFITSLLTCSPRLRSGNLICKAHIITTCSERQIKQIRERGILFEKMSMSENEP